MAASEMISAERGGKWPPLSSVRPPLCPPALQLPFPLNGLLVRDANVFWADVARAKPPFIRGGGGGLPAWPHQPLVSVRSAGS